MFVSRGTLVTKAATVVWSGTNLTYGSVPLSGYWAAYNAIYEQQLWVYTVVNKRASLLANLPIKTYARTDNNGRDERAESALAQLLRNPMPGLSAIEFWTWVASTEDIYGESFIWKRRDAGGRPAQLVPMHPTCVSRSDDDLGWRFESGTTRIDVPDADMIHFRRFSPSSSRRGLSPLEPLRRTLENEDAARRATSAFWRNGATPAFVLKHPGNLSAPAQDRLSAQFNAKFSGVDNTGKSLVLEEGMEAQSLTITAEQAQYIESRKLNREEVVAAYDMAPPAVHILDHATYSNITEQFRSVYRDTIGPWAHRLESVLAVQLVPEFDPQNDLYVEFYMDEVLRGDFETRQEALQKAKHFTIAEKRRIDNLPYVDGTDVILVNTADLPLDVVAQVGKPSSVPDVPDNVIPLPVARTVAGRLAWQKTLEEIDPDAVTAGLNGSSEKVSRLIAEAREAGDTMVGLRARLKAATAEEPPPEPIVTAAEVIGRSIVEAVRSTPRPGPVRKTVERDPAGNIVATVEEPV